MPLKFITWSWEEAFDKFGFDDGDGLVMTDVVAAVLRDAGYSVTAETWGSHNVVIFSIKDAGGAEQIPSDINLGYDEPRDYLPESIIALLDTDPRTGEDAKGGAQYEQNHSRMPHMRISILRFQANFRVSCLY